MILTANGRQLTPINRGKKFKCVSHRIIYCPLA